MASILIGLFTFVLVLVCVLLVLVILMQRPNANAGMGAALGGGMAEGAFGGEAGNVLTKATVKLTVLYFVISAGLYLGYIYTTGGSSAEKAETPSISSRAQGGRGKGSRGKSPRNTRRSRKKIGNAKTFSKISGRGCLHRALFCPDIRGLARRVGAGKARLRESRAAYAKRGGGNVERL